MKLKTILFGTSALLLASCSQDEIKGPENNQGEPVKATYMFTVSLPDDVMTRAEDEETSDLNLYILAYDADAETATLEASGISTISNGTANVSIDLVTGKRYAVSFVAGNEAVSATENTIFTLDQDNGTLAVNYSLMTAENTYNGEFECYYGYFATTDIVSSSTVISTALSLARPMAQVNWATNNLSEESISNIYGENAQYVSTTLTCNPYTTLNLVSGQVGDASAESVSLPSMVSPTNVEGAEVTLNDNVILATQYLLAPAVSTTMNLSLEIAYTGSETGIASYSVDVPATVQANYQTNIVGALLKASSTSDSTDDNDTTD